MERAGLDFAVPGMPVSEPDEVAAEGLAALGRGPVHIIAAHEHLAARRSDPDRAGAVLGADRTMRRLIGAIEERQR